MDFHQLPYIAGLKSIIVQYSKIALVMYLICVSISYMTIRNHKIKTWIYKMSVFMCWSIVASSPL